LSAINTTTHVGFTAQEHLDNLSLVDLNGRVYDPTMARFVSADPYVQAPYQSQSLNRYSCTWNNPLNQTDPTGFCSGSRISETDQNTAGCAFTYFTPGSAASQETLDAIANHGMVNPETPQRTGQQDSSSIIRDQQNADQKAGESSGRSRDSGDAQSELKIIGTGVATQQAAFDQVLGVC
jgi:RHS repeat-associated protein